MGSIFEGAVIEIEAVDINVCFQFHKVAGAATRTAPRLGSKPRGSNLICLNFTSFYWAMPHFARIIYNSQNSCLIPSLVEIWGLLILLLA